jgi:hypothetical protein
MHRADLAACISGGVRYAGNNPAFQNHRARIRTSTYSALTNMQPDSIASHCNSQSSCEQSASISGGISGALTGSLADIRPVSTSHSCVHNIMYSTSPGYDAPVPGNDLPSDLAIVRSLEDSVRTFIRSNLGSSTVPKLITACYRLHVTTHL